MVKQASAQFPKLLLFLLAWFIWITVGVVKASTSVNVCFSIFWQMFLGMLGYTLALLHFGTSMLNLVPGITLLLLLFSGSFLGLASWFPVFVTMFKPLGIVIAFAKGVICLGDAFYLGSLVGAIVIVAGFYSVMWGKAKEQKMLGDDAESL